MNVHGVGQRSPRRQVSFANSSLRQREWDHANSEKQKHEERTSKKMRFDGKAILLFHFCFILRKQLLEAVVLPRNPEGSQDFFKNLREKDADKPAVTESIR